MYTGIPFLYRPTYCVSVVTHMNSYIRDKLNNLPHVTNHTLVKIWASHLRMLGIEERENAYKISS